MKGGAATENRINFHQLRIFFEVARRASFSRAAEALDITQPAVSIQVQELERAMGLPLLHRRSRGIQLTEAGETVYDYANRIFSLSEEMQGAVEDLKGLTIGRLVLGASTTPGEYILPVAIGRFRQLYSGIQVDLRISNTRAIIAQVLRRELDLGMVGAEPENRDGSLSTMLYATDDIVLVTYPSHPLARRGPVSLKEIMDEGLVVREEGSATRKTAEECFAARGIEPRVVIELGSNQAVKLAAQAGVGVGVISRHGIGAETKAGLLVALDVEGWSCTRPLMLIYLKERRLSPAQRAFLELLETERPLPPAG